MPGKAATWTTSQLTDYELRDRRTDLERRLSPLPPDDARAMTLRADLDEIIAEQKSRVATRRARGSVLGTDQ